MEYNGNLLCFFSVNHVHDTLIFLSSFLILLFFLFSNWSSESDPVQQPPECRAYQESRKNADIVFRSLDFSFQSPFGG